MATLTITVDPETLERAEKKASEQGTSIDQLVETYLTAYAIMSVRSPRAPARTTGQPILLGSPSSPGS
jgi:hypothetical protein